MRLSGMLHCGIYKISRQTEAIVELLILAIFAWLAIVLGGFAAADYLSRLKKKRKKQVSRFHN
jgi:hypothetical protein